MPATSSPRLRPTPPSTARRSSRSAGRSSPTTPPARRGSTTEVRTTTRKTTCSTSTWTAAPAKASSRSHWPCRLADDTTANWTYNYDASLACAGGQLEANVNDGFRQSGFTATGTAPIDSGQKSPFSAILSPGKGKTFLQYSAIPLKGIAVDPEDGALTPTWKLINSANAVVSDGERHDSRPVSRRERLGSRVPTPWS